MESLLIAGYECNNVNKILNKQGYQLHYIRDNKFKDIPNNCNLCIIDLRLESFMPAARLIARRLALHVNIIVLIDKNQIESEDTATFIAQFAWDYCTVPIDPQRFIVCLGHSKGLAKLKRKQNSLADSSLHIEKELTNTSQAMQQMLKQVERVAPTNIPVLLHGASGTGKELAAKKLHQLSKRHQGPFVAVNCGAISTGLVQSELFGHEKGAFTGADSRRQGKIALANKGTLFLDEIGDLPMELQVNLLRFLQEGLYNSVGGNQDCSADVRVIAATHVDLLSAIDKGDFRLDLYYRLNGITIEMPDLKQRRDDILPLAQSFIRDYAEEYDMPNKQLSPDAIQALYAHTWPGNVRELINRIRRAVVLSDGQHILAHHLELTTVQNSEPTSLKSLKNQAEKDAVRTAIRTFVGKPEAIADSLQVSRATLYRLLEKHDLELL